MVSLSKDHVENESRKKRIKIFHLIGGVLSIAQLAAAAFLTPVRLVSTTGNYIQMTWNLEFSGTTSIPNPNVTYLNATTQLIGFDLSFLQPLASFLVPQILILVAAGIFLVTLPLRVLEVPVIPFILGKLGSLTCLLVLVMTFAVLTYSGALPLIQSQGINYFSTLSGSLGIVLVFTGATSGLGS